MGALEADRPAPGRESAIAAARACAWCVGLTGLVVAPAWLVYGILILEASFFGESPSSESLAQAQETRIWGRIIATVALIVVAGVAAWSFRRGVRAWGLVTLSGFGLLVTGFMWAV